MDINDTGEISVFGDNQAKMQAALDIIDKIIEEPEVDKVYEGTVVKIVDFGAFVNILPGRMDCFIFQRFRKRELRMFQQF